MAITTNKSVTLKASATGGTFTLNAKLTENSVSILDNTSNVTVTGKLSKGTGTFVGSGGTLYIDWYDNKTKTITQKSSKAITTLQSGSISTSATFNVEHNEDGTLSGYARARWVRGSSTYAPSSGSVSTSSTTLTNIPRNTTLSLINDVLGSGNYTNCVIRTNFKTSIGSSDYTTKLEYSWNGNTGVLTDNLTKDLALSFNGAITDTNYQCITFPYTFKQIASALPSAKTTTIQLKLTTYNGTTQVGNTFTYDYVYNIGEAKPTGSIALATTDTLSSTLSGNTTTFINGVSNVKMTFNSINFNSTATIKNYIFNGNGETITQTGNSYTFKNKVSLANDGFSGVVVTNRGNEYTIGSKNYTNYTTKDYSQPKVTTFTTSRADTTSTTINVSVGGTYWNKSFGSVSNTIQTISVKMIPSSGNTTTKTITPSYRGATFSGSTTFTLSTTVDATFELTISDKASTFTQKSSVSKSISSFDIGDDYFGINSHLYMNSKQIKNVATPTATTDATNKQYVDNQATTTLNSAKSYTDTQLKPVAEVLWSGYYWPLDTQTCTLSKKVSECRNGIILHWQGWNNSQLQNYEHTYQYIPKHHVINCNGTGCFHVMGYAGGMRGYKYVYVYDDKIVGHAKNNGSQSLNGVTYNNSLYVLSEIIEY